MDLLEAFNDLDRDTEPEREHIVHAPFAYPGGKSRSIAYILPRLAYTNTYVEPFGGSAAVLLARHSSKLEVYNDRYAGVVAFYRCLRDPQKFEALLARLELTIHAKEEFVFARDNWENTQDEVERAALWYTRTIFSFASLGRNFGRAIKPLSALSKKLTSKIQLLPLIHARFRNVQVENQDWYDCMKDYDSHETVFYCDPPYVDAHRGTFKHEMSLADHRAFIDFIFSCKGFVAVSGYANPVYDENKWDARYEWDSFVSISPRAFTESNAKSDLVDVDKRVHAKEVLWIKEAL